MIINATGAVKKKDPHPIFKFLEYNIPISICTDNTTVSKTNQNIENKKLIDAGLSRGDIENIHWDAEKYTFIK